MSEKNKAEIFVAGDGEVWVAPTGTALPTGVDEELDPAFVGLGYHTEDGTRFTAAPDLTDFRVWQSRQAARRELNLQDLTVGFELVQWNRANIVLAFGGGEVTEPTPGVFRYDFPSGGEALDERALVLDAQDGDRKLRFVIKSGNVSDDVETDLQRTAMSGLPISFKALEPDGGGSPAYILSNDAEAFGAGS